MSPSPFLIQGMRMSPFLIAALKLLEEVALEELPVVEAWLAERLGKSPATAPTEPAPTEPAQPESAQPEPAQLTLEEPATRPDTPQAKP